MVAGRALVTGATGGLGRITVAALAASGRPVTATGRDGAIGAGLAGGPVRFVAADLADPRTDLSPLLEDVETVFHLAALSSPWGPDEAFRRANVLATGRLLDGARRAGCRRFVFCSTPSLYTEAADRLALTEDSPRPAVAANAYARTKAEAEALVLSAHGERLATIAIRPRAIIGPFDRVLLPRLLRAGRRGLLPLPRGGAVLVDPTDARDAACALVAAEAAASRAGGRAFNISGGVALPFASLVGHVFRRLGRPLRILPVPAAMLLAVAGTLEAVARRLPGQPEPVLTRYGAMTLGWSQSFDLAAARRDLGFEPVHHPLEAVDWALGGQTS